MIPVFVAALADIVTSTIKSFLPDTPSDKLRAIELAIQQQTLENDIIKGQLAINMEEAKNPDTWVSGWRPAVGWVCVVALCWQFVILPILLFLAATTGHQISAPVFDTATLIGILGSMLGMGILRSVDKSKGK